MPLGRWACCALGCLAVAALAVAASGESCRASGAQGPAAGCPAVAAGDGDEASLYQLLRPGHKKGHAGSPGHAGTLQPAPPPVKAAQDVWPNPPEWGANVHVFTPGTAGIQNTVDQAYSINGGDNDHGHWSDKRFAFLFAPGQYSVEVPVGYYTSVAGLGVSPEDVVFTSEKGVYCREGTSDYHVGALNTFWRSAENFRTSAWWTAWNGAPAGMLWATSQATPLRRISVDQNLVLQQYEYGDSSGWASGGYFADSKINGNVEAGTQQQYFSRNNHMNWWNGGQWNVVSVGTKGAPESSCEAERSVASVPQTPYMSEKPYIAMHHDGSGLFQLRVPMVHKDAHGPMWEEGHAKDDRVIDFSRVYVAHAGKDTADSINAALSQNYTEAVVFTPGIYQLSSPVQVGKPGVVLLGLGFATLVASEGNSLIEVDGRFGGVRVASLMLQAGPKLSPSLLYWGPGSPAEPGFLQDIFARVGGPDTTVTQVDTMVTILGDLVVGDNFWLWRADHYVGGLTHPDLNPAKHGLVVEGDKVQMYGLAVEHTLQDLTIWKGEHGGTWFYQAELPYGVSQSFADKGYVGYRVEDNVKHHDATGLGIYTFFRDHTVTQPMGIKVPWGMESKIVQPVSVFLDGLGSMQHVVNGIGHWTDAWNRVAVLCPDEVHSWLQQHPPPQQSDVKEDEPKGEHKKKHANQAKHAAHAPGLTPAPAPVAPLAPTAAPQSPPQGSKKEVAPHAPAPPSPSEAPKSLPEAAAPAAAGAPPSPPQQQSNADKEVPQGPQPNPPEWGPNVHVFTPESSDIQSVVEAAYALNGGDDDHGQFSSQHFAFLFTPGTYDVDVPVGFYTSVAGLGATPEEVVFTGEKGVYCREGSSDFTVGALDTFWRSAENFRTQATWQAWNGAPPGMLWAASQAAPVRRVSVDENLIIFQYERGDAAGFASGGFLADSKIGGTIEAGGQQQYFSRNNAMKAWKGGVWSIVSVGSVGMPADSCQASKSFVSSASTPRMAEKPFIAVDPENSERFQLRVPAAMEDSKGPSWLSPDMPDDRVVDFTSVYVARAGEDTAETINAAMADPDIEAVVFTPGEYKLGSPLLVAKPDFVLLGLGIATLVATSGNVLIEVDGSLSGVRVAALLLQAGPELSPSLLHWGPGSPAEPGFVHDLFARVGGPDTEMVQAHTMVLIEGDGVVGDDFWLWRADHDVSGPTHPSVNPVKNGLVVHGDDVQMYGLAVEHTLEDLTLWTGENGATFFYQSELPYDVAQDFGDAGFAGYRVADNVSRHHAIGVGVYSFFRDNNVTVGSGIRAPAHLAKSFVQPLTVFLNGGGAIEHIDNDAGGAINASHQVSILCP